MSHANDVEVGGAGFTGVDWATRDPRELARMLTDGPGPSQSGELSAVWAAAAGELEAVASEYRYLAASLSVEWVSQASPGLDDRSRAVADAVLTLAERAGRLADRAAAHARDHSAARAAMPGAAEMDAVTGGLDAMDSLGPGLAGILTGLTDTLERAHGDHRRAAARVMTEYEQRTAPLAVPDEEPASPPALSGPGPAAPRTPHANASFPAAPPPVPTMPPAPTASPADRVEGSGTPMAAMVRPLGVYQAEHRPDESAVRAASFTSPSASVVPETATPASPAPAHQVPGHGPMPMAPMAPGAATTGGAAESEHTPAVSVRPGASGVGVDDLYGLTVAVAPAVLGEAAPRPSTVATEGARG